MIEPRDRAWLTGLKPDGTYRRCTFPCQKIGTDGKRLDRLCSVPVDPSYSGKVWKVTGYPDRPTLSPSVDCASEPCWHGMITAGEVIP